MRDTGALLKHRDVSYSHDTRIQAVMVVSLVVP